MPPTPQRLHEIPLFASLRADDLRRLCRLVQEQAVKPRTMLFLENAPYSGLYIVKCGRVKVFKEAQGKEQILAILGAGDALDPIPLFDGGNHSISAKTLEATMFYYIKPDAARDLLDEYPALLFALVKAFGARMRRLETLASDLAFKDVTARVCKALLEQAEADGGRAKRGLRPGHSLTRQEWASLVGTAREVAWRAIKKLEGEGLIAIQQHDIILMDVDRLKAMT